MEPEYTPINVFRLALSTDLRLQNGDMSSRDRKLQKTISSYPYLFQQVPQGAVFPVNEYNSSTHYLAFQKLHKMVIDRSF